MSQGESKSVAKCELCGEPMPPGEQMFKYHGYSGPCPPKAVITGRRTATSPWKSESPPAPDPKREPQTPIKGDTRSPVIAAGPQSIQESESPAMFCGVPIVPVETSEGKGTWTCEPIKVPSSFPEDDEKSDVVQCDGPLTLIVPDEDQQILDYLESKGLEVKLSMDDKYHDDYMHVVEISNKAVGITFVRACKSRHAAIMFAKTEATNRRWIP